jgi:hypothetical protein
MGRSGAKATDHDFGRRALLDDPGEHQFEREEKRTQQPSKGLVAREDASPRPHAREQHAAPVDCVVHQHEQGAAQRDLEPDLTQERIHLFKSSCSLGAGGV